MYNPNDTPLATGGIQDLFPLLRELQLSLKKLDVLYEEERIKRLIQEVEIYMLKEQIKSLEHEALLNN